MIGLSLKLSQDGISLQQSPSTPTNFSKLTNWILRMPGRGGGGVAEGFTGVTAQKLLLSQQFKYSMRLFEAKTVSFC